MSKQIWDLQNILIFSWYTVRFFWNCRFLTFYQEPIKIYLLLCSSKIVSHFSLWRSLRIWLKSLHIGDSHCIYSMLRVSNCVFASRGVSKGLKILRFLNLLLLVYKWQQRACFWEGNFKKSQSLTSMLYNFWNLAKLKRFWHQNTNCSTKTQPQTHRCLSMFKFFKEIRKVYLNSTGNSQGS